MNQLEKMAKKKTKKKKKKKKKKDLGLILAHFSQIRAAKLIFFSSKIWLSRSLDIMASYHRVQYQKKTNDPILRKLSDGRTDRRE